MLIPHQKLTIRARDVFSGFFRQKDSLARYLPNRDFNWIGSAREGLRQVLMDERIKSVSIPSFSCRVVYDSIVSSGVKPVYIDSGVIPSISELNTDALILPYNFGFVPDMDRIRKECEKNNVILIEDCAQALGARYNGKLVGGFGEYSVFSFGISKNIGFLGGLVNKDFNLPSYSKIDFSKTLFESLFSGLVLNKRLFGFFRNSINSRLKGHSSNLRYKGSRFGKNVVLGMAKRYEDILRVRSENAKYLMGELEGVVDFVKPLKNSDPSWLYFVILDKNRDKLRKDLLKERVDVQPMMTFCSKGGVLSDRVDREHLVFALYRSKKEIDYIVKKIKKVR